MFRLIAGFISGRLHRTFIALLLFSSFIGCADRALTDHQSTVAIAAQQPPAPSPSGQPQLLIQTGHAGVVNDVAFSPDGRLIATAGGERTIKLWEAATARQLRSFEGHIGSAYTVAFSPDGKTIASGGADGLIILWETGTGNQLHHFAAHDFGVYSVAFSPDGKVFATGGVEDTRSEEQLHAIKLWDAGF